MRELYQRILDLLKKLDFEALTPGFHRYPFALYDREVAYFEDKERKRSETGFFGNTAIEYEGNRLAIWNVEDVAAEDVELLTANMVHEMFHAFQMESGFVKEWPNDLKMLHYPDDYDNFMMKQSENRLIAEAMEATGEERRQSMALIYTLRKLRREKIGEYLAQEELVELLEGKAESCCLLALKQLNEEKYRKKIKNYITILREGSVLFDVRRVSYYSGALLRVLENEMEQEAPEYRCDLRRRYLETKAQKENIISEYLEQNPKETTVDTFICGYDPMNQFRVGNLLYAKNIIFLNINGAAQRFDGPIVLQLKDGTDREVVAYYLKKW